MALAKYIVALIPAYKPFFVLTDIVRKLSASPIAAIIVGMQLNVSLLHFNRLIYIEKS
jgi:hypothetical protein